MKQENIDAKGHRDVAKKLKKAIVNDSEVRWSVSVVLSSLYFSECCVDVQWTFVWEGSCM